MFRRTELGPKPAKAWLGILCVLLASLPFGALTGLMAGAGVLAGLPCLVCVPLCAYLYERILKEPGSQAGLWIAALLGLAVCLTGLCVAYVRYLYQMDLEYGYSLEQAVGLLPSAIWDPEKLPLVRENLLSVCAAFLLGLFLGSRMRRLRLDKNS